MATNKQGRRTRDFQTALHAPNIMPDIVHVDGNLEEAGFLAWLNELDAVPTFNNKFEFYKDDWLPLTDTTAATATATATTIQVTTPLAYIPKQLWKNKSTGEVFYVDSVDTAGYITVVRGVGRDSGNSTGTAATAMGSGDTLVRLGPVAGEVSRRHTFQSTVPVQVFNYTQKMRAEIQMSDWQRATKHITGRDWPYQVDKAMKQFRKDLNGTLIMGERNTDTQDSQTIYYTGGLDFFISSNTKAVSGTLHEYDLDQFLDDNAMRNGPNVKLWLGSSQANRALTEIGKDQIQLRKMNFTDQSTGVSIGAEIRQYVSPMGKILNIMEDRFLSEAYSGYAYIVDLSVVRMRHFSGDGKNGMPHIKPNTQESDADDHSEAIIADLGFEVGPEEHHAKLTGITGGAAGRAVS